MNIKIIDIPPGEAPEEIRRAWVGILLPAVGSGPHRVRTLGVKTGRFMFVVKSLLRMGKLETVYFVNARKAVELLGTHNPEAAAWWRQNTPQLLKFNFHLAFNESVCEVLKDQLD